MYQLTLTLRCGDLASAIKAPALAKIIRELCVYTYRFYGCEVFIY